MDRTIAVDLSKSVFEIAVSDKPGHVVARKRLSRKRFEEYVGRQKPATVVMEACGSSHHWGRRFEALGHRVRLLPPQYVRPYVRRNKTDRCDAKALLEAHRDEDIYAVPIKTTDQHAIRSLHGMREGWMGSRIARLNAVRGHMREMGITIPGGAHHVVPAVYEHLDELPVTMQGALVAAAEEIKDLNERIRGVERELKTIAGTIPEVGRLMTIPGVGLLTSTAMVGMVGDIRRFRTGRHFSSYLGLTPRENSSGMKRRLGRISKRGNRYLRTLLVHGARSVLRVAQQRGPRNCLEQWAVKVRERHGYNKATVALANKLARRVWAVWRREGVFEARQ
jgi:transposase